MRFDQSSIMEAQRRAFAALTSPQKSTNKRGANGKLEKVLEMNKHYVPSKYCTAPAMLIQELAWVNTTPTFTFDFSINGPGQTPGTNNNIKIGKNDIFAFYGIQILFGTGTSSASFVYRAHGVLPADDSMYNSFVLIKTESSTYVDKMEGQYFRDNAANANEFYGDMGLQIINPVRIISGEVGTFQVVVQLKNPIAALVLSANTVISMRLHGVYGQAQG